MKTYQLEQKTVSYRDKETGESRTFTKWVLVVHAMGIELEYDVRCRSSAESALLAIALKEGGEIDG